MKKKTLLIAMSILFISSIFSGCGGKDLGTAKDYFSFKENTVYNYIGSGYKEDKPNYGNISRFVEFADKSNDIYQVKWLAPYTAFCEIVDGSDKENIKITGSYDSVAFYDYRETSANLETLGLVGPIEKGTQWNRANIGDPGDGYYIRSEITDTNVEITVPHGTYNTIEVTNLYDNTLEPETEGREAIFKKVEYYAKDIGLVKQINHLYVYGGEEETRISELESITEDVGYTIPVRLFHPVDSTTEFNTDFELKQHSFGTNEDITAFFEDAFKTYDTEGVDGIIGESVEINSIDYSPEKGKITIDFTKELTAEMTTDAETEQAIIQSIANTMIYYFGGGFTSITVDGGDYVTDNMTIKTDETIQALFEEEVEDEADETEDLENEESNAA